MILLTLLAGCVEYGIASQERSDTFAQLPATELDVLLVVDNSCSMQPYQAELAANFDEFLSYFEAGDVDYHIGVTTTSILDVEPVGRCAQFDVDRIPAPGQLVDGVVLTPDTADGELVFEEIVNVGTCGHGYEMGLEAADQVLQSGGADGFLRDEAFLSVIFVSDEQDSSPDTVNEYLNSFRAHKDWAHDSFNASAIVLTDPADCTRAQLDAGGTVGTRYVDVADQGQGIIGNICDDSFSRVVTELSLASSRLSDRFYLTEFPNLDSLVVNIDGEDVNCLDGHWTYEEVEYDGRDDYPAIVFDEDHIPAPFTEIVARYLRGDGGEYSCGPSDEEE